MSYGAKTTGQSYYDAMPEAALQVGDVWESLPSFGHFRALSCGGIVITPACDLANRKVETVTYLPVIPVRDYLLTRAFGVEYIRVIRAQCQLAGISILDDWRGKGFALPALAVIEEVIAHSSAAVKKFAAKAKERVAAERILAAAQALFEVRGGERISTLDSIRFALGPKEYERLIFSIINNSYSSDIHFLPSDGRSGGMSVIRKHSVALFRYPLSLPVELLDAANDVDLPDWGGVLLGLEDEFPITKHASEARPVKVGQVKPRFLPDLISRFAALHIRMGSPDFTSDTVGEFAKTLE